MPEGPSLVIAREAMQDFVGKKVLAATGNVKTFDPSLLKNKKLTSIRTWGKHLLLGFGEKLTVRIHFLMFGTYRVNEQKESPARLALEFAKGKELNFYTCAVRLLEAPADEVYDWTADVMNESFDPAKALKKLKANPEMLACDALLNQEIFSGVGNIIKNEVLFRIKVHPESKVGLMPLKKQKELVKEAVNYAYDFLEWKKEFKLREHWLAHTKRTCPRDNIPFSKGHLGKTDRRSFWCEKCQVLYTD